MSARVTRRQLRRSLHKKRLTTIAAAPRALSVYTLRVHHKVQKLFLPCDKQISPRPRRSCFIILFYKTTFLPAVFELFGVRTKHLTWRFYFPASGGSSDDFGNDDSSRFHGLQRLPIAGVWISEFAVQTSREQARNETGFNRIQEFFVIFN